MAKLLLCVLPIVTQNDPTSYLNIALSRSFYETHLFAASGNFEFIPYNNVPQGFAPYITSTSSKVFIAVPRRSPGVPSTLNYVNLEDGKDLYINPKLHSYPNYETNELDVSESSAIMLTSRNNPKASSYTNSSV